MQGEATKTGGMTTGHEAVPFDEGYIRTIMINCASLLLQTLLGSCRCVL